MQRHSVQSVYDNTTENNTLPVDEIDLVTLVYAVWKANNRCFNPVSCFVLRVVTAGEARSVCVFSWQAELWHWWYTAVQMFAWSTLGIMGLVKGGIGNKAHLPLCRQWTHSCWHTKSQPRTSPGYGRLSWERNQNNKGDYTIVEIACKIEGTPSLISQALASWGNAWLYNGFIRLSHMFCIIQSPTQFLLVSKAGIV